MDGDAIIGILMVLFWLFSGLVARISRKAQRARPQERPPEEGDGTTTFQRALEELAEQMGVEVEVAPDQPPPVPTQAAERQTARRRRAPIFERPVASEHRPTETEHRRTASEVRRSPTEHDHTPGWHDRTASEVRRTASEAMLAATEHQMSGSEHVRGDAQGTPIPALSLVRRQPRSKFAKRLRADLTGGSTSLARAMVLREILGPPVGLRSPDSEL